MPPRSSGVLGALIMLTYTILGLEVTVTTDDNDAELAEVLDALVAVMPSSDVTDDWTTTTVETFQSGATFWADDADELEAFIDILDRVATSW